VGDSSYRNRWSSISAPLDQANNQGNDEGDGHGNDLGNEDRNDRHNDHGNDNTEGFGDTNHGDDTYATRLGTVIDLAKKNRPLLDRLGKFGKVLESLLGIGTAVSEVNSLSVSTINVSNPSFYKIHPIAKAVLASINVIYQVRSSKFGGFRYLGLLR
jgi:hypothetical protein